MSRQSRSAMAGSLDLSRGLRITLILNLVLAGFYYAFAGEDAAAVSGTVLGFSTLFTLIAHCGLPFAEAAFVSLFIRKKDYRSVLYVRMVSGMFAIGITVFVCIVLALCAGPLALVILGGEAPAADISMTQISIILCCVFGIFETWSCWLRGFWQGADSSSVDEKTQTIGSISVYLFSALIMAILVYGFHLNRAYSVYGLCGGLILSRILMIAYMTLYDRMKIRRFEKYAKGQSAQAAVKKKVFSDLFSFSVPSLSIAVLLGLFILSPVLFTVRMMAVHQVNYLNAKQILALVTFMLPMITMFPLMTASASAERFLPQIAEIPLSLRRQNGSHAAQNMIIRYLALSIPVSFSLGCLAPQFFQLFYGTALAENGILLLRFMAAEGVLAGLCILCLQLTLTVGYGSSAAVYTGVSLVIRLAAGWFLTMRYGLIGIPASALISLASNIFLCLSKTANRLDLSFPRLGAMALRMILASFAMNGVYVIIKLLGFDALGTSRLMNLALLCAMAAAAGIVCIFIYRLSSIPLGWGSTHEKETK